MKAMILITLITIFMVFFSCGFFSDPKFSIQRTDYIGNEIRTDGYYYYFVQGTDRIVIHFFYKNGITLWVGTYANSNITEIEKEMVSLYSMRRKMKSAWGLFLVNGSKIQYERIAEDPSSLAAAIDRRSGYIINDTTIYFTENHYSDRNETKQINQTWHFKQFDNKPDSTNRFIK